MKIDLSKNDYCQWFLVPYLACEHEYNINEFILRDMFYQYDNFEY